MGLTIGEKYVMNPPFGDTIGEETIIVEKADNAMKVNIEALFAHHANGMDWCQSPLNRLGGLCCEVQGQLVD